MPALEKAKLMEIGADKAAAPVPGTEIAVQFNPQSLKLSLASKAEGGEAKNRQTRQWLGKSSTTLAFDLHFDTADEGTTDAPVSVRTKTAMIERFVLPKGKGNDKQAPPKARFVWGELILDGIIEDITIDFDLFASDGTPLRAKISVSMKEQDAKYELLESGPGANAPGNATPPGESGNGPGTSGGGPTDSTRPALGGESVAEFAARNGLDPAAWRGIAGGLDATLSLQAGLELDFSANLSLGAGIGVSAGVTLGASASLEASFGLDVSASASISAGLAVGAKASAGFALSAAGGVSAAVETVKTIKAEKAAADTRRAFGTPTPPKVASTAAGAGSSGAAAKAAGAGPARGVASLPSGIAAAGAPAASLTAAPSGAPAPSASGVASTIPPSAPAKPAMPEQPRPPMRRSGIPSATQQAAAPPAPTPPLADARATSFGFGVPLRPRVSSAADVRAGSASGRVPLKPRPRASDVLAAVDPGAPPWERLPADPVRARADKAQHDRHPARRCGCHGPCHHRRTKGSRK